MSIALKDAVKIVTDAVNAISNRFPIKWEDITNKPTIQNINISDYYTKEEVDALLKTSHQLTAPDGSIWEPSIDNNGNITWKKVIQNGQ
ncbi:hypothetical protein [Lactiplantibacillus plantarum]|uniref:hypothetical protein n=1 Tax=Lactiplantibacillus plantarum TaxID=1590 RepID=UPI000A17E77C|nr:hypothetical protein [Lactiplantibacillus plantarum]ARK34791.1 hypothetical protein B5726_10435 [Lactiplantibacillus plantarum]QAR75515.1 hypothetical protein EQH94_05145 [Lactiplantibacillus plantarum]QAS30357.1 hypothetical protein EQK45_10435 [Lactiplantibacillus plantarum]QBA76808.1 hypothetical protein EVE91_05050 [Lactiplantibacillus plantarum]RWZ48543.1 hypothetical protein EQJ06_10405 [Lactiplantibacillus plantarum]